MTRWFRWYEGASEDGKFRVIARNSGTTVATVIGVWAMLLEDASHSDKRGFAKRDENFYGAILDLDIVTVHHIICEMEKQKIVRFADEYQTEIVNWKERQFETDVKDPTNAKRQERYRKRQKALRNANGRYVTPERNGADVVGDDKSINKNNEIEQNARNGRVTERKLPDTDTESKNLSSSSDFEKFYSAYPKHVGKKAAKKAFDKAIHETTIDKMMKALERQKPLWKEPQFIPHPATWLNRGQWDDELFESRPSHLEGIL